VIREIIQRCPDEEKTVGRHIEEAADILVQFIRVALAPVDLSRGAEFCGVKRYRIDYGGSCGRMVAH